MREGIVALVLNPQLESGIPPAVKAELAELEGRIRSGALVVPRGAF
jgi:hypothetical protein